MELRVLRYFLAVAREENITRAAALLHLTQPTLSRQLMQLEEELGVQLFHRSRYHIVLTDEGMLLRRRAQELVDLADKTAREFAARETELMGEIAIGAGETRSMTFLSQAIRTFRERYPKVIFRIFSANADDVKERLDMGLLDMGLLTEPVDVGKYAFWRMQEKDRWGVLVRTDSPLAELDAVTPQDLESVPLLVSGRESVQGELASWFGDEFDKLNVLFTSNLSSNGSVMVCHKLAYAIVIKGSISLWNQEKITYRPLNPELSASSVLAWRRQQPFGLAASKFIEHIKRTFTHLE